MWYNWHASTSFFDPLRQMRPKDYVEVWSRLIRSLIENELTSGNEWAKIESQTHEMQVAGSKHKAPNVKKQTMNPNMCISTSYLFLRPSSKYSSILASAKLNFATWTETTSVASSYSALRCHLSLPDWLNQSFLTSSSSFVLSSQTNPHLTTP